MARKYNIAAMPLAIGNVIDYMDGENRYLFKIMDIKGDIHQERKLTVKRLQGTTDNDVDIISDLIIQPGMTLEGNILNVEPSSDTEPTSPAEWNKQVVKELSNFLLKFPEDKFRKPFQVCLDYLINLGLLPDYDRTNAYQTTKRKALLASVCRNSQDVLRSRVGYIVYVKGVNEAENDIKKITSKTITNVQNKTINMYHLIHALEHLAYSGIFGDPDTIKFEYSKNPSYKE